MDIYVRICRSFECPDISLSAVLRFLESFDRIAGPKNFMEYKTNYWDFLLFFFFFFFLFLSFSFFNMNNTCLRTTYFLML